MEKIKTSSVNIATVAQKSFNGKFTIKIDFLIGHFTLPLLTLTLEVQSLSIHYLISIWTHAGEIEQNRIVGNTQNFELFDKKWLTIFEIVLTPFWKTFL